MMPRTPMAQISLGIPDSQLGQPPAPRAVRRLSRWLASDRVFPKIPYILVEGLFVLTILVPFILTIWISMLKWRANRPFETARFAGLANYEDVLTSELFWSSLGRTFYFA